MSSTSSYDGPIIDHLTAHLPYYNQNRQQGDIYGTWKSHTLVPLGEIIDRIILGQLMAMESPM